jgi:transcriptional regulator with XRE-family HTH domain
MSGKETMGQKLRRFRQAAGMSQSQLAKAADVPLGTLRNWEQDRRSPLLDTAGRIARTLGVSLDDLLENSGEPARPAKAMPSTPPASDLEATAKKLRGQRRKKT